MKSLKLLFFLLLCLASVQAQAQNPFEEFGYNPKIATLSKGKYVEFIKNDTIVQVGNILYNTITDKIIGFVENDTLNFPAGVASRWWSIDPLAEKHYNHSPYIFTANNPILYVDPDGRDYGVYYDHEKKTITIKAHFITLSKDEKSAKASISFWNNESGKHLYVLGEGKEAIAYTVNFDLTTEVDDTSPNKIPGSDRFFASKGEERASQDFSNEINSFISLPDNDTRFNPRQQGTTINGVSDGDNIFIKESRKYSPTGSHEVGHNLGNSHDNGGLMSALSAGGGISKSHISETLARVGIGNGHLGKDASGKGKVNGTVGNTPENFAQGRVMTVKKFQKMQEKLKK